MILNRVKYHEILRAVKIIRKVNWLRETSHEAGIFQGSGIVSLWLSRYRFGVDPAVEPPARPAAHPANICDEMR